MFSPGKLGAKSNKARREVYSNDICSRDGGLGLELLFARGRQSMRRPSEDDKTGFVLDQSMSKWYCLTIFKNNGRPQTRMQESLFI